MAKTVEEKMALIDQIPDELAKNGEFVLPETMAIAAAHEVRDDDIVFAGTGLPMVGIMCAQLLNAPHALLIYEAGVCDGKTMHVPASVCDHRAAYLCSTLGGLVDTFGYYLQQGFVTLGYLGGAAVDMYGGVNCTCIGDYYHPTHRFTGSGGNGDIGTLSKRVVYIIMQEKRRFVEKNDYNTTPGWWCTDWRDGKWKPKREVWKGSVFAESGPAAIISNMAVFRFDENGIIYLDTFHPGVSVDKIKQECSFDLNVSRVKGETRRPTYRELFVVREFVDPERIFLPEPLPEYPPNIKKLIES
jgi:glutaconate CoA-transferase subunit B